jgi:hypothetical protein
METNDLSDLLGYVPRVLTIVAVSATLRVLLNRRKVGVRGEPGAEALVYGPLWRWGAVVLTTALLLSIGVVGLICQSQPGDLWFLVATALAIVVLGGWLIVESFGVRHRLTADGIERVSPWHRVPLQLRWDELESIRWRPNTAGFVLRGRGGQKLTVSHYLSGLGTLAQLVLDRASADIVDREPKLRQELLVLRSRVQG